MAKDIFKKDLYSFLDVAEDATDKEIISGYRKKALKCHPDKNPDNPKAAELFHELSKALEILTDVAARAAYDQTRKAKKAAEARNKVLDSKRKKFKEDLEARERAFLEQKQKTESAEKKLQQEIARLREEGSRLLEQEQERLKQTVKDESCREVARIKLRWKVRKGDPFNGGYNKDIIENIFSSYGHISALIVSSKRGGSAIVEFGDSGVDSDILDESGLKDNPLTIVWLSGKPVTRTPESVAGGVTLHAPVESPCSTFCSFVGENSTKSGIFNSVNNHGKIGSEHTQSSADIDRNYESLVLMKMRQAEERKRLIEEMMKDDKGDE